MDSWRRIISALSGAMCATIFSTEVVCASASPACPTFVFRGVNYTSWSVEEYGTPASEASIVSLLSLGVNSVALLVTGYMDTMTSTKVYIDPVRTPSDSSLTYVIQIAHSHGLKVMLKPHVDSKDGVWRGSLSPADIRAWFASYEDFVVRYAALAAKYGVELFCVGTEFRSLSGPEFRDHWKKIIEAIRQVYSGSLVYAANWDEYSFVSFWDLLDYAGVDAYFPLSHTRTPEVRELLRAWEFWLADLERWQMRVRKPVMFTEIGYRSIDYAGKEPWSWMHAASYNPEAQANCYEAALQGVWGRPWFVGLFFWNWLPDPHAGGAGNTDYTPQNKPAQEILAAFFQGGCDRF